MGTRVSCSSIKIVSSTTPVASVTSVKKSCVNKMKEELTLGKLLNSDVDDSNIICNPHEKDEKQGERESRTYEVVLVILLSQETERKIEWTIDDGWREEEKKVDEKASAMQGCCKDVRERE